MRSSAPPASASYTLPRLRVAARRSRRFSGSIRPNGRRCGPGSTATTTCPRCSTSCSRRACTRRSPKTPPCAPCWWTPRFRRHPSSTRCAWSRRCSGRSAAARSCSTTSISSRTARSSSRCPPCSVCFRVRSRCCSCRARRRPMHGASPMRRPRRPCSAPRSSPSRKTRSGSTTMRSAGFPRPAR